LVKDFDKVIFFEVLFFRSLTTWENCL
jgi:hypothetical protein